MKAIILAAGRGSRMKHLTDDIPKCLLKFRGKSLIDWQLQAINEAGVSEISIVTGYKRELLSNLNLKEFFNQRWSETNMVSSLECAKEWLQNENCIVSYSDLYYQKEAIHLLQNSLAKLSITYDKNWLQLWSNRFVDPLLDAETFQLNFDHTLKEIGNKPTNIQQIEGQYMGLLKFTPEAWLEVEKIRAGLSQIDCDKMHMTGTLQKIIEYKNIPILAIPYNADWGEFDSEGDLDFSSISLQDSALDPSGQRGA